VDRLDEEDDAVILLGSAEHAYLLPRALLLQAGIDREAARGVLSATRTGASIEIDAWPCAGAADRPVWQPDPALLAMQTDVTGPDWERFEQSSSLMMDQEQAEVGS
jgi:hypothetical protein